MEWLQNNWIWIAAGAAFFAMHLFGHGGHSGHNRDGGDGSLDPKLPNDAPRAEQTGANGAVPRTTNPTNPVLGGIPARSNHAGIPTTTDEKQHRHGC